EDIPNPLMGPVHPEGHAQLNECRGPGGLLAENATRSRASVAQRPHVATHSIDKKIAHLADREILPYQAASTSALKRETQLPCDSFQLLLFSLSRNQDQQTACERFALNSGHTFLAVRAQESSPANGQVKISSACHST